MLPFRRIRSHRRQRGAKTVGIETESMRVFHLPPGTVAVYLGQIRTETEAERMAVVVGRRGTVVTVMPWRRPRVLPQVLVIKSVVKVDRGIPVVIVIVLSVVVIMHSLVEDYTVVLVVAVVVIRWTTGRPPIDSQWIAG